MTLDCGLLQSTAGQSTLCDLDTKQTVRVQSVYSGGLNGSLMPNISSLPISTTTRNSRNFRTVSPSRAHVHCIRQPSATAVAATAAVDIREHGIVNKISDLPASTALYSDVEAYHTISERSQEADTPNLLWLLDYRLDPIIETTVAENWDVSSRDVIGSHEQDVAMTNVTQQQQQPLQSKLDNGVPFNNTAIHDVSSAHYGNIHPPLPQQQQTASKRARRRSTHDKCCNSSSCWLANQIDVSHEEVVIDEPRVETDYYARHAVKPPCTYTELIEQALLEKGELTVSGIYSWITQHFVYYRTCDDRWKNSVRHNLSMNPYFRKGSKARAGSGHLWVLAAMEGRSAQRRLSAARMGRPLHQQVLCDVDDDNLLNGITSNGQDIWLSSTSASDVKNHTGASVPDITTPVCENNDDTNDHRRNGTTIDQQDIHVSVVAGSLQQTPPAAYIEQINFVQDNTSGEDKYCLAISRDTVATAEESECNVMPGVPCSMFALDEVTERLIMPHAHNTYSPNTMIGTHTEVQFV